MTTVDIIALAHQRSVSSINANQVSRQTSYTPSQLQQQQQHHQQHGQLILSISGMTCSSCVSTIENALKSHHGVMKSTVNLLTEKGDIVYDTNTTDEESIIDTIEGVGFDASILSSTLVHTPSSMQSASPSTKQQLQRSTSLTSPSFTAARWQSYT